MPLAIQPLTPAAAALAADLGVALQSGTTVNAQVLRVLDANLVRIAIGALTLDATTQQPLQQGQRLQLLVGQTGDAITLTPVRPGPARDTPATQKSSTQTSATQAQAPLPSSSRSGKGQVGSAATAPIRPDDIPLAPRLSPDEAAARVVTTPAQTLTPQETRAVARAAQVAVTKQSGLSQLFANLAVKLDGGDLPQPVAVVARQLLGLRQTTDSMSAADIRAGLTSSGLLFEASAARQPADVPPDLKSTLLVLKQVLSTWVAEDNPTVAPRVASSAAVAAESVARPQAEPEMATRTTQAIAATIADAFSPPAKGESAPPLPSKNLLAMQLLASAAEPGAPQADHAAPGRVLPPPFREGAPTPQPVAPPSLPSHAQPAEIARQLLSETDGALARQTLLQVASLPDRIDQQTLRSDPAQPRWHFEIPFATLQGTAMAQFEIARDGGGSAGHDAARRVWRARFSLNIEPAGPVHALITYGDETTHVKMWAERPATAAHIRAKADLLSATLNQADLNASDIIVADGAPTQTRGPAAGQFLNRAT